MISFSVNQVVTAVTEPPVIDGDTRILHIDATSDIIVLITIEPILKRPWAMSMSKFSEWIYLGLIKVVATIPPKYMLVDEASIAEADKAYRDRRWEKISGLISNTSDDIYHPATMGRMVYSHANLLKVPAKSIYRMLYQYWAFGMIRNAFLPNRVNIGSPGKAKVYKPGVIPGRKPRFLGEVIPTAAKLLNESDKRCIRTGFALYAKGKEKYISGAYTETLRRFYSKKHIGGDSDDIELLPTGAIPTEMQFQYWGRKYFDDLAILRGRAGEIKWLKDHRAISGTVRQRLYGPGHLYEIDATVADVYLVSRYNRNWLVGRPVVYVVIDSFSGMIVGIHVGLEGPSWNGARQALFNAFTDKVAYCERYGVHIEHDQWPCHHLPHEIFADRGEMIGNAAEGLASGLKINLGIAPPYRPDWKPIVESAFKVLNDTIQIQFIPGAVIARETERGARDYRQDAVLDLQEFTEIVLQGVLHYNKFNRQPDRLTLDMIAAGIEPTPIAIWQWAQSINMIEANYQSDTLIYLHLLPRDDGTIHKGGILFKGMFYVCEWAIESGMFARARHRGSAAIICWYDPNFTEHIWIQGPDKTFIRCDLRLSEVRYHGFRTEEVEDMLAIQNQVPPQQKRAKLESKVAMKSVTVDRVKIAAQEKKATATPSSKAGKIAGIDENRAWEKELLRKESPTPNGIRESLSDDAKTSEIPAHPITQRTAEIFDLLSRLGPTSGKAK
jgi:putative transposase